MARTRDDEDERPSRSRDRDDDRGERRERSRIRDDEDEKPRRSRGAADEDEKPRRSRDDDDDDAPRARRRGEDEDEKPRRSRDDDENPSKSSGGRGYLKRTADQGRDRANMKGGDFDTIIKSKFKVYKIREGKNILRILPATWEDADHYGYDVFVNYGIGADKQSYLSLSKMKGEKDPLAEARKQADRDGDKKVAKALQPRQRVVMWVIDRQDEDEGPQVFNCPFTLDKDIANICYDEDTKEFVALEDPEDGCDFKFVKEGKGLNTKYPASQMKLFKPSKLSDDADQMDEWLDYIKDNPLPTVLQFYDYDHIANVFDGHVEVREDDDDEKPRGRGRGRDRDDDEKPSRSRSRSRDDEDERPRRSRDDDEDEKPRRSRARDDDEDEKPRRSRNRDDDEEPPFEADEKPKRSRDEPADDDEEEKPRSGKKGDDEGGSVKDKLARRRRQIEE